MAEAKRASAGLAGGPRGRRANTAMLQARIRRAEGDPGGASALLENELRSVTSDGGPLLTLFAIPLVTAGEWRLAAGDARGADSLARLALRSALVDSLSASRSAFAGRAQLLLSRAQRSLGNVDVAQNAAQRAVIALANGYGGASGAAREARALVDSLLTVKMQRPAAD